MGISGMDGRLIESHQKDVRLGYVGEIDKIHIRPVVDLLERGYIPVISTIGCDREGNAYNINGDTAAAYIAGALNAERLIMMTDVAGILRDKDDPSTLITELTVDEAEMLAESEIVSGGMIPKVDCCINAIKDGSLAQEDVDRAIERILQLVIKTPKFKGYKPSERSPHYMVKRL